MKLTIWSSVKLSEHFQAGSHSLYHFLTFMCVMVLLGPPENDIVEALLWRGFNHLETNIWKKKKKEKNVVTGDVRENPTLDS